MKSALRLALAGLVLVFSFAGASGCGVSDATTPGFVFTGVGPEGGTVQAGDVLLIIPAGALGEPTAVNIAPQGTPLPIAKPGGDPCTYAFLGPIWCCGPLGQDMQVPAFVRLTYDESLIPAGHTEADLVLLLWDDANQTLEPVTVGVVHDVNGNFFETSNYLELGHLAVAVRTCAGPVRPIVFLGINPPAALVRPSGVTGPPPDGLHLATADNSLPIEPIPTEGDVPDSFVPSSDGQRVLYEQFLPQTESRIYRTIRLGDAAPVTVVGEDRQPSGSDPLFGWFRDAERVYFFEYVGFTGPAFAEGSLATYAFSQVPGDGSAAPSILLGYSSFEYLSDVRQSDDGTRVLLRVTNYASEFSERIDVIDSVTGELISSGLIPVGGGHQTPRFVPGSTDVCVVTADGRSVERYDAAGALVDTIYALDGKDFSRIVDFVLSPAGGGGYAAVLEDSFVGKPGSPSAAATIDGEDTLEVGTLAGGPSGATALGSFGSFVQETVFHPDGEHVILDMAGQVRVFGASDATLESLLPVPSMSEVDVNRTDGRLLLVVKPGLSTDLPVGTLADGLYVAAADGSGPTPVDSEGLTVLAARWLFGLRNAPGMFFVPRVR